VRREQNGVVKLLGRESRKRLALFAAALLVMTAVAGCATAPKTTADATDEISDPIEPVNRVIFDFNMFLDRTVMRPVTRLYVNYVPEAFRMSIRNVLEVLNTPIVAMNELLQGNVDRFMQTAGRFTLNIAGGIGVLDVAGDKAPPNDEDFGQTLAVWGAPSGPYLMLPLLGPSTIRDAIGKGVDSFADPSPILISNYSSNTNAYLFSGTRFVAGALDQRSKILGELEELERTSLDFYATVRSLYIQKRRDEIRNGGTGEPVPIPEISFDRDDTAPVKHADSTKGR
jgi:phospholipid-binding lipoprotein MlaA